MRVSPINNFAQQQNVKNEQPNFKGLWGNIEVETQREIYTYEQTYEDVYLTRTKEYYPFIDETREEFAKEVDKWTSQTHMDISPISHKKGVPDAITHDYKVKVVSTLPIKMKEWAQYITDKLKLSSNERFYIEETLKRYNLKNYLR